MPSYIEKQLEDVTEEDQQSTKDDEQHTLADDDLQSLESDQDQRQDKEAVLSTSRHKDSIPFEKFLDFMEIF